MNLHVSRGDGEHRAGTAERDDPAVGLSVQYEPLAAVYAVYSSGLVLG